MGCANSRESAVEEKEIKKSEKWLGFSKHSAESIDYVIRKYSKSRQISRVQLLRICETFSMNQSKPSISELFKSLENADTSIDMLTLLILGLLLCNCNKEEKSSLIFQSIDEDSLQRISPDVLKSLLSLMVEISLKLPLLVFPKEQTIENYTNKLKSVQEKGIEIVNSRFKAPGLNFVSESHFSEIMTSEPRLLTPTGWRSFLFELYSDRDTTNDNYNSR